MLPLNPTSPPARPVRGGSEEEPSERIAFQPRSRGYDMPAQRKQSADVIQLRLDEEAIIEHAIGILSRRLSSAGPAMGSPGAVKNFLTLQLAQQEREVFSVLWLDARNRLIAYEALFFGTLTQTSVYPREVVKGALRHNCASLILAHNHPSGEPEPSAADRTLTEALKSALSLVDVRVLDHIIVAGTQTLSFAERGLL
jgi:DNA repair protein RadC